eukprot:13604619-Alexandrium_andersonii.AAC.1
MSASLVGSEMCIRDSINGHVVHVALVHVGASVASVIACCKLPHAWNCDCLLYTSDAADDM